MTSAFYQKIPPQRCVHVLIPKTCEYDRIWEKVWEISGSQEKEFNLGFLSEPWMSSHVLIRWTPKRRDTQTERVGQADTGQRVEAVTSGDVHTATSNFRVQVRALPWGLWRECGPANTGTSDFGSRIIIQYIFFVCFQPWEMNRMSNITYHAWEYLMCSHLILIICSWKAEPWTYPSEYPEKMTVHCDCHVSSHRQVELPQRYMLLGASKKQR